MRTAAYYLVGLVSFAFAAPSGYPAEPAYILTPPSPAAPRINGAAVFGARPGNPFLFTIAATGDRPLTFSAAGLPAGLTLDPATGRISGSVAQPGEFRVRLTAANARGSVSRDLRIVIGDQLALTPPMGWNSWNCFASAVTAADVRAAADAFVRTGLIDHGWTYINIDDYWMTRPLADDPVVKELEARSVALHDARLFKLQPMSDPTLVGPARDAQGRINANPRFPDMAGLADYVHGLGLKIGIYSSPGPLTCGQCTASYGHEAADAARFAAWGFDYLKYDWCTYHYYAADNSRAELMKPYAIMGDALRVQKRDIVFSLCQYGMGDVWQWGGDVGGNCWRTTNDINDTWKRMAGIGFSQDGHEAYARPGHWNDPDMLVVGWVGWGRNLHPTRLSPDEQYTHMSLWSLLSAPLLIGCDLTRLDAFTLGLLTNDEVLAVDQDPLGRPARRVVRDGDLEVWSRPLADGSTALGLFNRGEGPAVATARWTDLGLSGPQRVRDLWRQRDIGVREGDFSEMVPRHGVVLVKITPAVD
jgi:alpha-galactosidase